MDTLSAHEARSTLGLLAVVLVAVTWADVVVTFVLAGVRAGVQRNVDTSLIYSFAWDCFA